MADSILDRIESFAVTHCGIDGRDARDLCRAVYQGEVTDLPEVMTEVGRTERAAIASLIATARAQFWPQALAEHSTPASASTTVSAATPAAALPDLTGEARAAAIRAMGGSDLSAMAEVLIAGSASVSDAHAAFKIGRAHQVRPSNIPSIAERAASQIEMGPADFTGFTSAAERKAAGWKKAFVDAEARRSAAVIV